MAKGSQATWSPNDSRTCIICGKKIALVHGAWIHYNRITKEHTSAHLHCGPPLTERSTMHNQTIDETSPSETQPEPSNETVYDIIAETPVEPEPTIPTEPPDPDTDDDDEEEEDVA